MRVAVTRLRVRGWRCLPAFLVLASRSARSSIRLRRTAIALMAFGFAIEKFDLFLQVAAPAMALRQRAPHGQKFADAAGLAFIGIGVAMVVVPGIRFAATAKAIDNDAAVASPGQRFDLALDALVALLRTALFLYMLHAVLPTA